MTDHNELPEYDELTRNDKGAPIAWNLFGPDDNVGMINLQTAERVSDAATLVRKGSVFALSAPVDLFVPSLSDHRSPARRANILTETPWFVALDDVFDNFYTQGSSQWDALAHVALSDTATGFYNGASLPDVQAGLRNGIDHWARRGIAGRGVVLDLEAVHPDYDRGSAYAFTVDDLEKARVAAGIEYRPGDVLIVNTGFAKWYSGLDARAKWMFPRNITTPGLEHSEEMVKYLWNAHPSAIVSDNYAVEVFPPDLRPEVAPFGFIHQVLIGGLGIAFGELWWLADLVDDCRADGRYEVFLVSAPMNVTGGIGSTANALALK